MSTRAPAEFDSGRSSPSLDLGGNSLSQSFLGDAANFQIADVGQPAVAPGGDHVVLSSPYPATADSSPVQAPAGGDTTPLLNDTIKQQLGAAGDLMFTTPADNQSSPPDYRLSVGDDGQLRLEKVGDGDALADGKLNIEIDPKNKSLEEAIKNADKNLKEYVREMMQLWQKNHPGKPHPSWWDHVLNSQPEIPNDARPVPIERSPQSQPQPQPQPRYDQPPPSRSTGGGFTPGGGFAGRGGFDNSGYFRGSGNPSEGRVWTGGHDQRGAPVGPGEQAQAKDIYDYLIEKGFNAAQASGILGNIQQESNFRTDAYNSNEGAIGICQWLGGRRTNLERFAADQGKPVTDLRVQLDFMMHEFATSEQRAFAAVKAAQTPEEAAVAFQSKFERSASLGPRAANASAWYSRLATGGANA